MGGRPGGRGTGDDPMTDINAWRKRLGPFGVWAPTDALPIDGAVKAAVLIESLGYSAIWLPETMGRDPFAHIAHLAGEATSISFATGEIGRASCRERVCQ